MLQLRHSRRPLAEEGGFTLPELLVAMTLGLLVAFGAMSLVVATQRAEPRTSERAGQIQQGRVMVERMVRELRQGERIYNPTSSSLEVLTRTSSSTCGGSGSATVACRVAYSCSATACSRAVQLTDGSWQSQELVSGILGPSVFSYETPEVEQPPNYVAVELQFPGASGTEAVTVADGAELRNWTEVPGGV